MVNQFGDKIKQLREANSLLQRQVAGFLDIDTPMLSKIERGERKAKKEQIIQFAKLFKTSKDELMALWLASQILDIVDDEKVAAQAIGIALKQIKK